MPTYPKLLLPERLLEIMESEPPPPVEPIPPKEKILERPIEPNKPGGSWIYFIIVILMIVITYKSWLINNDAGIFTSSILTFLVVFIILSWSNSKNRFSKDLAKHNNDLSRFLNEQQYLNTLYRERTEEYKFLKMPAYEADLRKYNLYIKKIDDSYAINFRKDRVNKFIKDSLPAIKNPSNKSVRSGLSEAFFFQKLKNKFGDIVHNDLTIEGFNSKHTYTPDIVVVKNDLSLKIDIEIDEPYVASTHKPIHYIGSNDFLRDEEFTQAGWIVIRFAEEQIIKQTQECVKVVDSILKSTENLHNQGRVFEIDQIISAVEPIDHWDEDEAIVMAYENYRATYLPFDMMLAHDAARKGHEDAEKITWLIKNPGRNLEDYDDDLPF